MLSREKKEKLVDELAEVMRSSASVLFADFAGLKMSELNELKGELRKNEVVFKATKKSLWPFAFKKAGLAEEPAVVNYGGSIAVAYGRDEGVETAKVFKKFAKTHEALKIIGGFFWKEFRDEKMVLKVAELPNREILLGITAGVIVAPLRSFVGVLQAPLRDLVGVIKNISNK